MLTGVGIIRRLYPSMEIIGCANGKHVCRLRYGRPKDHIVPRSYHSLARPLSETSKGRAECVARLLRIGMSGVDGNSVFLTRLLVEVVVDIDEPSEG